MLLETFLRQHAEPLTLSNEPPRTLTALERENELVALRARIALLEAALLRGPPHGAA